MINHLYTWYANNNSVIKIPPEVPDKIDNTNVILELKFPAIICGKKYYITCQILNNRKVIFKDFIRGD